MDTPICDFVKNYIDQDVTRLHMPGHKGKNVLGFEEADVTEVLGADSLYQASGIIKKSEDNASRIFGAHTLYSTEGSSLCIKAMLYLAMLASDNKTEKPYVIAGRNAHKAFISSAVLLGFDIKWLYGKENYLSCKICPNILEEAISNEKNKPVAVYITSPDYLGNIEDIKGISEVCKKHNVLLIVDNAHGAYLKFLGKSLHPIDLGADMCSDSAHKTLPVLTGGAYLHISKNADPKLKIMAKDAMLLFGSTSPSYLILQSLDMANICINNYKKEVEEFIPKLQTLKDFLYDKGFEIEGNEPLKLTLMPKSYGYTGEELADILRRSKIECEFSDPDFVVLMFTPQTGDDAIQKVINAFDNIEKKLPLLTKPPKITFKTAVLSARDVHFMSYYECDAKNSKGRIFAGGILGCPPAVSPISCGEVIDENDIKCFEYYGIKRIKVVKE